MIWKLALPVILVIIGISLVFKDIFNSKLNGKIKELNKNNVKNNEGYIVYYENNGKYFLGYKRGKDKIIETQTVREINVAPKEDIDIITEENSDMASLKITLPVSDNNDNYDLVINYITTDNHATSLEEHK